MLRDLDEIQVNFYEFDEEEFYTYELLKAVHDDHREA